MFNAGRQNKKNLHEICSEDTQNDVAAMQYVQVHVKLEIAGWWPCSSSMEATVITGPHALPLLPAQNPTTTAPTTQVSPWPLRTELHKSKLLTSYKSFHFRKKQRQRWWRPAVARQVKVPTPNKRPSAPSARSKARLTSAREDERSNWSEACLAWSNGRCRQEEDNFINDVKNVAPSWLESSWDPQNTGRSWHLFAIEQVQRGMVCRALAKIITKCNPSLSSTQYADLGPLRGRKDGSHGQCCPAWTWCAVLCQGSHCLTTTASLSPTPCEEVAPKDAPCPASSSPSSSTRPN